MKIESLIESDFGRWVLFVDKKIVRKGRLKSYDKDFIYVVFNCNDDWDFFHEYTGDPVRPESLQFTNKLDCSFCGNSFFENEIILRNNIPECPKCGNPEYLKFNSGGLTTHDVNIRDYNEHAGLNCGQ